MAILGRKTTWTIWIILFLFYLFMAGYVMEKVAISIKQTAENPDCADPLDLQIMGVSADEASKALSCMGPESRKKYRIAAKREDLLYNIVYGILFSFTIFSLSAYCIKNPKVVLFLTFFSFSTVFFDFMENYFIIHLIDQYPALNNETVWWMSTMNKMKWLISFTTISLICILAGITLIKSLSRKKTFTY